MNSGIPLERLYELRHNIHRNPDLSGSESGTAERLINFIEQFNPDKIIKNIANNSFAAVFDSGKPGPVIMLRSELDALPIQEVNDLEYKSVKTDVSHKCGHDGHMAILAGVAALLSRKRSAKGKVILLYQEAEETGQGAYAILKDPKFEELEPDYIFALHNLPGFEKHNVIVRYGAFASASKGMTIKLKGKSSHAAEPENGISPLNGLMKIAGLFGKLHETTDDFSLVTVVQMKLGEKAFGTSPGHGEISATLRSYLNNDMARMTAIAEKTIGIITADENLEKEISYTEEFPATINNEESVNIVKKAAEGFDLDIYEAETPFRWSEDFGHFLLKYKGACFGLGAGKDTPQLHNPNYDFPNELIETGINLFEGVINKITGF